MTRLSYWVMVAVACAVCLVEARRARSNRHPVQQISAPPTHLRLMRFIFGHRFFVRL